MMLAAAFPAPASLAYGSIYSTSRLLGILTSASNASAAALPPVPARITDGSLNPAPLLRTFATGAAERHDTTGVPPQRPHEQLHAPPTMLKSGGSFAAGAVAPHPGIRKDAPGSVAEEGVESHMPHPAYTTEYVESVRPTHVTPEKIYQHVGLTAIRIMRWAFDRATGYGTSVMTEAKWLQRFIFLETVAGVPGMVAGMLRHLKSLRSLQRDHGWIHTLLEEAENERMHLITFLEMRKPGPLFRAAVIGAQGVFFNAYFLAYLVSPRTCHAFIGFLEEEAVKTYTHALEEIDAGRLWPSTPAPPISVKYWGLPKDATMRDLLLAVRADEACHAHVNHTLSKIKPTDVNPFAAGASQLP